jgi:hypothetical protein
VCTMSARLTCRPPLIRALCSAATESWHPRHIGGCACASGSNASRWAGPQGPRGPVVPYTCAPLLGAENART